MKKAVILKFTILILWLSVIASLANTIIVITVTNNDTLVLLSLIPLALRLLIIYYLNKGRDIISYLILFSALIILFGCIQIYIDKYNVYDIPLYFQIGLSIIVLLIVTTTNNLKAALFETDPKTNKRSNRVLYIVWVISIIFSRSLNSSYNQQNMSEYKKASRAEKSIDSLDIVIKSLKEGLNEINQKAPYNLDEDTRIDTAYFDFIDTSINYKCTFFKYKKSQLNIEVVKKNIINNIVNKSKSDTSMTFLTRFHINTNYFYYDKNQEFLFDLKTKEILHN